jgi:HEAT repeat protein
VEQDVHKLIARLNSIDAGETAAAAEALCQLGREAQPAAVALVRAAGAGDEAARGWVVAALEEIGSPSAGQIDELVQLLDDPAGDVRYWAVTLLGRAGAAAAAAVEAIVALLRHSPETATRERAAWALGKIGPRATLAEPALRLAAESNEPRLSRLAKSALVAIAGV